MRNTLRALRRQDNNIANILPDGQNRPGLSRGLTPFRDWARQFRDGFATAPVQEDEVLFRTVNDMLLRQGLMPDMTQSALHQGRLDFYLLGFAHQRVTLLLQQQPWRLMVEHQDSNGSWQSDLGRRHILREVVDRHMHFGHDLNDPQQAGWNDVCRALDDMQRNDGTFCLILLDPHKNYDDQILLFDGAAFDEQPRRLRMFRDQNMGGQIIVECAQGIVDPFGDRYDPAWTIVNRAHTGILAAAEAYNPGRLYDFVMRP